MTPLLRGASGPWTAPAVCDALPVIMSRPPALTERTYTVDSRTDSLPCVDHDSNLTHDLTDRMREAPEAVAISRRHDGHWQNMTVRQLYGHVIDVARGLIQAGIESGDRVAILSSTRYEWTLIDYAIWFSGAVTVPIYQTSSADQIAWILSDATPKACWVETAELSELIDTSAHHGLQHVWSIEDGDIDALIRGATTVSETDVQARGESIGGDDLATIVYTSGTTGPPKGCMITHRNLRTEIAGALDALPELFESEDSSTLLFLPLAHVFARIIQVGAIRAGSRLGHTSDIGNLTELFNEFKPSFVLAVPRVFEKVYTAASQKAYADNRGKIFDRATQAAIAYSRALDTKRGPGVMLRIRHRIYDKLVFGKLRDALGGRAEYAISGGAPLGVRLSHFYRGIGLTVLEGYGLTETTGALAANTPADTRMGTVGKPLAGAQARVRSDGELIVRGPQVFAGYWNNPTATEESLTDGWFATGDLADIDADGFIQITGRKKEILVTAGGKNVVPSVLEDRVRAHPVISQCLVVGDGKPFIAALITIDRESWTNPLDDPKLNDCVQKAVDDANTQVSKAESIRKFCILADDWTEDNGYLTPSFKVKRNLVLRDYSETIEALFSR